MFELLARANPAELLTLLGSGDLSSANLSFAAEAAGRARLPPAEICAALTPLLHHPKGYVREGALYGLAQLDDAQARRLLGEVAAADVDEDVRQVAAEILGNPLPNAGERVASRFLSSNEGEKHEAIGAGHAGTEATS